MRPGWLQSVDPDRHVAGLGEAGDLTYDKLIIATGAVTHDAFPGAITFGGVSDAAAVAEAFTTAQQLVFVAPVASGWSLPLYELALLTARARPGAGIAVVTAEPAPLWIFGEQAETAIRDLFVREHIALLSGVRVLALEDGELKLENVEPVTADRAVALPRMTGPAIAGLPHDDEGFIPVGVSGAVTDVADVYAAGDVTTFPLKQGGLAAEQADAVAEAIAADLGAPVTAKPFYPVLRGLLFTGGPPLYLSADGTSGTSRRLEHHVVSGDALWWPPAKVASRYLAPLLPEEEGAPPAPAARIEDLFEPPEMRRGRSEGASELALMLAHEDALRGDFARALRGLDTAQALAGGELPDEWERARTMWTTQVTKGWR